MAQLPETETQTQAARIPESKTETHKATAFLIILEGQFQVFQRFSSSKLVLETVESCFMALNYHENGSTCIPEHQNRNPGTKLLAFQAT